MDFLNVSAFSTSASTTKVLVLDGNTVKSRTAAQVVTDGGGSSGGSQSFQMTLIDHELQIVDSINIAQGEDGWGWPYTAALNQSDSLLRCSKFLIPFKPANYRFSAVCYGDPNYLAGGGTPASGDFGIKFQYSTNNSSWTDIGSILFKNKVTGDLATGSGTITIGGTDTLFYIRTVAVNTLSPATGVQMQITNFVANFWS